MSHYRKRLMIAIVLANMGVAASYAQTPTSIVGSWQRMTGQDQWIRYQYQSNGQLLRATNRQPDWLALGKYQLDNDIIYFKDNPDGYTPVRFVIKSQATCHQHSGPTLYLYDQQSGKAYGCYFKIE